MSDRAILSRVFGFDPSEEILKLAKLKLKKVLEQLISHSREFKDSIEVIAVLTDEELKILRQAPAMQEIIQFLRSVR